MGRRGRVRRRRRRRGRRGRRRARRHGWRRVSRRELLVHGVAAPRLAGPPGRRLNARGQREKHQQPRFAQRGCFAPARAHLVKRRTPRPRRRRRAQDRRASTAGVAVPTQSWRTRARPHERMGPFAAKKSSRLRARRQSPRGLELERMAEAHPTRRCAPWGTALPDGDCSRSGLTLAGARTRVPRGTLDCTSTTDSEEENLRHHFV